MILFLIVLVVFFFFSKINRVYTCSIYVSLCLYNLFVIDLFYNVHLYPDRTPQQQHLVRHLSHYLPYYLWK